MLVLILRSAHVEDVRQTSNARARVSKDEGRASVPSCFERIAAQRCWGGGVLVRAATLLSTRGEDARRIWRNEADGEHACLLHAKPTCGCRKRSPAPIHCFRPVIYNEWYNSNGNLAQQRNPRPREAGRGWRAPQARAG